MKQFFNYYFKTYSVLYFLFAIYFQVKIILDVDLNGYEAVSCLMLPISASLLVSAIRLIFKRDFLGKVEGNGDGPKLQSENRKQMFNKVFFALSFFILVIFGLILYYFDLGSSFRIYMYLLLTLSYLIVLLIAYFYSNIADKQKSHSYYFYKTYCITYPIVLLIFSLGFYGYQNLFERDIDGYRYGKIIIFILPILTLLLSLLVGYIVFTKKKDLEQNDDSTTIKPNNLGKFFLISSVIITVVNFILIVCKENVDCFDYSYLGTLMIYYFFTSYLVAILLSLAYKTMIDYWVKSKLTTILFLIIFFQLLLGTYFLLHRVLGERVFNCYWYEYYNHEYDESSISEVAVQEVVPYREEHEVDKVAVEAEEKAPFYLSFLWNDPEDDQINVTEALIETKKNRDFDNVVYQGISYMKESNLEEPLFKIVRYISENRESIDYQNLFETYKDLIVEVIPESVYKKNRYDIMLKLLYDSYYDLQDYEADDRYYKMRKIYYLVMNNDTSEYIDKYKKIVPYIGEYYKKRYDYFGNDILESPNYRELVWAYSFWGRRYKEGNIEQAINLIHEIRSLYNDYEEESY